MFKKESMKAAIITGGSQGLGKKIAKQLANLDYQVIILARREEFLKKTKEEIGQNCQYYVCDISSREDVEQFMNKLKKEYKKIDLLVNNAGVWVDDQLQKDDPEMMKQALMTNVFGMINITEALLPLLKGKTISRIFNVISTSGVEGIPAGDNTLWKTYGASKWGAKGYTNSLRESLRNTNVQVLQFFPGGFESNLYENAGRANPHHQPWMMKTKDVAEVAVFAMTRPDDVYMESIVLSKFMK